MALSDSRKFDFFGTDGIRSLAGKFPLTKPGVWQIGIAAGTVLQKKTGKQSPCRILLGRDPRLSGSWLEQYLSAGMIQSGCAVLSCGVIPTSAIAALLLKKKFSAGAVISASHNPSEFNGIKFFSADGKKIPDSWEREIEAEFKKKVRKGLSGPNGHTLQPPQIYEGAQSVYVQFLEEALSSPNVLKGMRWVLDSANGSASAIAPELFRSLGAEVISLSDRPDGKNINLKCGALHTQNLQRQIVRLKADGGCAFDGDADRVQFADEKGKRMDGDILLALAANGLKQKRHLKKNCVVTTVMANFGFFQQMKKSGIRVVTTEVGDRAVSDALQSNQAVLGGEQSGHIIFRDHLPTGDGLLTALKILSIVKESGKKLSYFTKSFPKCPQILINLKVKKKIPVEKIAPLTKIIRQAESGLDGRGRILVRYSGTEPLLRVMVEGPSMPQIRAIAESVIGVAKKELND